MQCPKCQQDDHIVKNGTYLRKSDKKRIQSFLCKACNKRFSTQTFQIDYRHRKRHINQQTFKLLCQGVSQRSCAFLLGVRPKAIAIRIKRFGAICKENLEDDRKSRSKVTHAQLDELETFETCKYRPLTVPVVVEAKSRKILSLAVGQIAAKGHLAQKGRLKDGYRKCERHECLSKVLSDLKQVADKDVLISSDDSTHYPKVIKSKLPEAKHERHLSQRSRLAGLGELKKGGFDPIFSINHTLAKMRDCIKRLSRRTWATTKKASELENLLFMYAWFHNLRLDGAKGVCLKRMAVPN